MLRRALDLLDRHLTRAEALMAADAEAEGVDAPAQSIGSGARADGKQAVDQLSLIVRTIEKIDQLLKDSQRNAASAAPAEISPAERAALGERIERWIDERAEERARVLLSERAAELQDGAAAEISKSCGGP